MPFFLILWLLAFPQQSPADEYRTLVERAQEARRAGRVTEAGRLYLDAKAVADRMGDRARAANALINYSAIPGQQADYPAAQAALDEARAIAEDLHDDDLLASALSNSGIVARLTGDYDAALADYTRALALARKEGQRETESRVLTNIGLVNAIQGHYKEAIDSYERSLAIRATLPDGGNPSLTINNIGAVYESQGNLDLALEYYQRALAINETSGGDIGAPLSNIAHVYKWTGRRAEALRSFQRVLELHEKRGYKTGIATALYNIASISQIEGRYADALDWYQRSLAIRDEIHDQSGIAESLEAIAETLLLMGRDQEALDATDRNISVALAIKSKELLWQPQTLQGQIYRRRGDLDASIAAYRRAIATIEALRDEVAGGSESRERFLEDRVVAYRGLASTLIAARKTDEALDIAERAHGRVLAESLQRGASATRSLSPEERERQKILERDVVTLTARVAALEKQGPAASGASASATERLREARVNYDAFRDALDARYPVRRLVRGDPASDIRRAAADLIIDETTAIVEYVVGENETDVFVVARSRANGDVGVTAFALPIERAKLSAQVDRFDKKLASRALDFHPDAQALYTALIKPIAASLASKTHLIVIPDASLWYVPFHALEPSRGVALVDRVDVSYAPSISVLHAMHERRAALPASRTPRLLVAADPSGSQPALAAARQQATTLTNLYGARDTRALVGADATEARVRGSVAGASVLHFATHGVLDDASPMYSFLQLTPKSGSDASTDGRLEAWEIESLQLDAQVAVLTACDTGRGRVADGEGVIGLTWAFFAAGTPSTVVSLWKLESESAAALTLAFHQQLRASLVAGHGQVAPSLRSAALTLRRDPRWRHPFYWAGLVPIGDAF